MTTEEFLTRARNEISNDPETRVSPVTRAVIARRNFVFDAHCHVFDGNCVNVRYIVTRMLGSLRPEMIALVLRLIYGAGNRLIDLIGEKIGEKKIVEAIYDDENVHHEDENVKDFLDRLEQNIAKEEQIGVSEEKREQLHWIRGVVKILRKDFMKDVYENFRDNYAISNVVTGNKELITIALGMDLNKGWEEKRLMKWGRIRKSNATQIEELGKLAESFPVLPFLPLDPRRAEEAGEDNLYTMFLKNFKDGDSNYFGVKFYPSLGYLPSDSRLKPIFDICAEKKIPVVTHCGGESVSTFKHRLEVNDDGKPDTLFNLSRTRMARYLNEPDRWAKVLQRYTTPEQELYLNFGHFGSAGAWADPTESRAPRIKTIINMMSEHKVFTDFSFNLSDPGATERFAERLHNGPDSALIAERCMYGTDFWVVLPRTNLHEAQAEFIQKIGNHADEFLIKNVMRFLRLRY